MPLDPRLLVPLSVLPAKPAGAPCAWPDWPGYEPEKRVGLLVYADVLMVASGQVTSVVTTDGRGLMPLIPSEHVYLDLAPPEPSGGRVDGLDVGLRLLGWEPGWPVRILYDTHEEAPGAGVWLEIGTPTGERRWTERPKGGFSEAAVPALADIDPSDPLALRLAAAAVLRAGAHPQTKE